MVCISAMAQLPLPHDYAITSIALYRLVGTLYISDDLLMGQDQLPRQLGSRGLQTWECQESRKHSWVHCSWQSISILRFCRQYSTLLQLFANLTNAQSNGYSHEAWGIKKCIEVDFTGNQFSISTVCNCLFIMYDL